MDQVFYGEIKCTYTTLSNKKCNNNAYYIDKNKYGCGVHTKKESRKNLPKRSAKDLKKMEDKRIKDHKKTLIETKNIDIILTKMYMMKKIDLIPNYLNIFPNHKHQHRKDGFGCSSLSPKCIGPIDHKQEGLPKAVTLEVYHQNNKVFPFEINSKGELTKDFIKTQICGYERKEPWRHKYGKNKEDHIKKLKKLGIKITNNINIPLFSVHKDEKGNYIKYTYIESRWFYCKQYENFAIKDKNFKKILKLGFNINIIGYDARPIKNTQCLQDELIKMYKNIKYPFGHELVLACLLFKELGRIKETPWNIIGKPISNIIIKIETK